MQRRVPSDATLGSPAEPRSPSSLCELSVGAPFVRRSVKCSGLAACNWAFSHTHPQNCPSQPECVPGSELPSGIGTPSHGSFYFGSLRGASKAGEAPEAPRRPEAECPEERCSGRKPSGGRHGGGAAGRARPRARRPHPDPPHTGTGRPRLPAPALCRSEGALCGRHLRPSPVCARLAGAVQRTLAGAGSVARFCAELRGRVTAGVKSAESARCFRGTL